MGRFQPNLPYGGELTRCKLPKQTWRRARSANRLVSEPDGSLDRLRSRSPRRASSRGRSSTEWSAAPKRVGDFPVNGRGRRLPQLVSRHAYNGASNNAPPVISHLSETENEYKNRISQKIR